MRTWFRNLLLAATLGCSLEAVAALADSAPVQITPFTDSRFPSPTARLQGSFRNSLHSRLGTVVQPSAERLEGLRLNPVEGLIEVWCQPHWSGADGQSHRLWATSLTAGRQLLLEKSEQNMLRAELTTPSGLTVARTDISHWRPDEWHHVAVGWLSHQGKNVGLVLWIDKVAVDGPVTPYGVFAPEEPPSSLILGGHGETTLDELIVRTDLHGEGPNGMVACVYRDYFRTAPYDAIRIDPEPTRVPSDRRVVAGFQKPLGLQARRQGRWELVTEQVVRYSQWAYFDAKPMIEWSSSHPRLAIVDTNGLVTGLKPGRCQITARFHGLQASYPLTVLDPNQPDLGVICIELLPRYACNAVKSRPSPGETVTARVRFGNFGLATVKPGAQVRFSLFPRSHAEPPPVKRPQGAWSREIRLDRSLAPGETTTTEFRFPFPTVPTWMQAELDPLNQLPELCEANNRIVELTTARPIQFGYNPQVQKACVTDLKINHVGSFSYFDWLRAEKLRMDVMLREAIWPTTGPKGVEEAYRIDAMVELTGGKWEEEPYQKQAGFYDGGFPVNEPVDLMAIDCAIIHEFGHTILSQPDLYGYPVSAHNVLVTDVSGKPVAGSATLPIVAGSDTLPASGGINVACYAGYPSLMDGCQLWLHPSQAGHILHYRGYREDRFWGTQGRLIPSRANWLLLRDAHDQPLRNAAIYVYHVSQAPVQDSGAKFFADRPKFTGQTGEDGRFVFPSETDPDWDDPETDAVDGAKPVWNPFGTAVRDTAFTPNVWEVQGLLLIRIVAGNQSECHFMDLTQFNTEYLSGHTVLGQYVLRTSLSSAETPTPVRRKRVPEAIRKFNKAPVAVAPTTLTVRCGERFVIDGSKSYDPEGQPLIYRWNAGNGWLAGSVSQSAVLELKAPKDPRDLEYKLWVLDGIRSSEPVTTKVKVIPE